MTTGPLVSSMKRASEYIGRPTALPGKFAPEALSRSSGEVFCVRRGCHATISVVHRQGAAATIRYVQWCSLRGAEVSCPEDCILQPNSIAALVPSAEEPLPTPSV